MKQLDREEIYSGQSFEDIKHILLYKPENKKY